MGLLVLLCMGTFSRSICTLVCLAVCVLASTCTWYKYSYQVHPVQTVLEYMHKAQMYDIIKLSVKNIYQSREVIEKELSGYQIINNLLDKFITAYNNNHEGKATNYDKLLLKILPEKHHLEKETLYDRLLHICHFISMLTDGKAVLYNKIVTA